MACILYREGTGTIEHGIECESTTCEIEHLHGLLAAGWSQTPPGYEPPEPVVEEEVGAGDDDQDDDQDHLFLDEIERLNGLVYERDEEVKVLQGTIDALHGEIDQLKQEASRLSDELASLKVDEHEEEEEEEGDSSNLDPVRIAAREAGIEGWDTKRITTLKRALEA
ncbi:hypothetical protein SAMN03159476_00394 [Pseudomonas sp. NFPP05]|uniref:hypothetical protein n=1 Tax=unclassified Pseudomonas TaxID=196821 RepID=UPI0008805D8B|nr:MULTISPECIES: hypothetical protein [unclassified Pseudomonas]SDA11183.1 hypothetical protein SAMN03159465_00394 [Pseudomonas sp. NFPP12]SFM12261.1 hypothetical protein SAMN03159476_00394 [Pseudomonas sp. NFPP05]